MYTWNEWAIYVVSTLRVQTEDLKEIKNNIESVKTEIELIKSHDVGKFKEDFLIFKTTVNTKVTMITLFISVGVALLSLIIQFIFLIKG